MSEKKEKWGYKAGPGPEMCQEIGQIMVNHSYCEWGIRTLYAALLEAPPEKVDILINSHNLKAQAMAKTIETMVEKNLVKTSDSVKSRILSAITEYRKLSEHRNIVAHWHWLPEDNGVASADNLMKGANAPQQKYSLADLKNISLGLIMTFSQINVLTTLIDQNLPDFAIKEVLSQFDRIELKVREAVLDLPDAPCADEVQA